MNINLILEKKSSIILVISKIYDEILNNIDQRIYSSCIFVDLEKVFDTVNHDLSIEKLEFNFGFRSIALNISKSYLTNRKQYTKIGNKRLKKQNINCSVPQGYSLESLLFIL